MYEDILKQIGLNESEIEVYNCLLVKGELTASKISLATSLNRTNVYNVLENLQTKGLVETQKKGSKTMFLLAHPSKLAEFMEAQQKQIKNSKTVLDSILPKIISDYNLSISKPGVRFYEGEEGSSRIDEEQSKSKTEILQYSSPHPGEEFQIISKVPLRIKSQIKKKILTPDIPYARNKYKNADTKYTEVRYLSGYQPFFTNIVIFDGKVAYINSEKDNYITVIIDDKNIYQAMKANFEYNWRKAVI